MFQPVAYSAANQFLLIFGPIVNANVPPS